MPSDFFWATLHQFRLGIFRSSAVIGALAVWILFGLVMISENVGKIIRSISEKKNSMNKAWRRK